MDDRHFVICIKISGYEASLEPRKVDEVLPDPFAREHGQLRVMEESGEDYLYPASFFLDVELRRDAVDQVAHAA
jgi:hypothetical protein